MGLELGSSGFGNAYAHRAGIPASMDFTDLELEQRKRGKSFVEFTRVVKAMESSLEEYGMDYSEVHTSLSS